MKEYHHIKKIIFEGENMILQVDAQEYFFQLSNISSKLTKASHAERERYIVSSSGYGIHWPLIDEDISIDGLLGIKHNPKIILEKIAA